MTTGVATVTSRAADVVLFGQVGADQLRVAEELRQAGGDLWMSLSITADLLAGIPPTMATARGDLSFPVRAGEWGEQLDHVEAGSLIEVLVAMPDDTVLAGAVGRLREARRLLRDGRVDAAVVAARLALEPVLEAARDGGLAKGAAAKAARDRDLDERFAVLVESMFSLVSGAAHDDAVTATFRYTREDAVALIAATAGLVKRLAAAQAH
jgi:hypothetical protein